MRGSKRLNKLFKMVVKGFGYRRNRSIDLRFNIFVSMMRDDDEESVRRKFDFVLFCLKFFLFFLGFDKRWNKLIRLD